MIGYVEHVYDRTWKPCSQQKFYEILSSSGVAHTIRRVRSGNKGRKNRLPAFIFGGSLDEEAYRLHTEECQRSIADPTYDDREDSEDDVAYALIVPHHEVFQSLRHKTF